MESLRECPCCESTNIILNYMDSNLVWKLYCSDCGITYTSIDKEKIIKFWNSRPKETSLQEKVSLLGAEIEKITTSYSISHSDMVNRYNILENNIDILNEDIKQRKASYNTMENKYVLLQKDFDKNIELQKQEIDILQTKLKDAQTAHQHYIKNTESKIELELRDAQLKIDALKKDIEINKVSYTDIKNKYDALQKLFDKNAELSKQEKIALQIALNNEKIKHQHYIDTTQSTIAIIEEKLRKTISSYNIKLNNIRLDEDKIIKDIIGKTKGE